MGPRPVPCGLCLHACALRPMPRALLLPYCNSKRRSIWPLPSGSSVR